MFTFVETKLFTQLVQNYFSDDEYAALQNAIIANPEAGDVIKGSGVAFGSCDGAFPGVESEAAFASSITCDSVKGTCGC